MARPKVALVASVLAFALAATFAVSVSPGTAAEFSSGFEHPETPVADASYRLGTGDKVRVIVFGEQDLGGDFQIDDGGFIRLPLIGQWKAAGSSPHELEGRIAAALG